MGFYRNNKAIPANYRWILIPVLLLLLVGADWYFLYQPRAEEIARLDEQIAQTRQTLEKHQRIAATYDEFRAKVAQVEASLRELLTQLPKRREIPDLIRQISDLGVRTGLQISLLRPQPEQARSFMPKSPLRSPWLVHTTQSDNSLMRWDRCHVLSVSAIFRWR